MTAQPGPAAQPGFTGPPAPRPPGPTGPTGQRTAVYRGADAHPKETCNYNHAPTIGSGPLAAAACGGA
jgi:hypothetical protein